jgi:dimethylamine/trimethylamine dehydrogenase
VIAEKLRGQNLSVIYVTPESIVSTWGGKTSEQHRIQKRLIDIGVDIITGHELISFNGEQATVSCVYSNTPKALEADSVVTVTSRIPNDLLYSQLMEHLDLNTNSSIKSVVRIGDCEAPAIIAGAVFSGHRYAQELDESIDVDNRIKYDRVFFEDNVTPNEA